MKNDTASPLLLPLENTFAAQLQGLFVPWPPAASPAPSLVKFNHALAQDLGLDAAAFDSPAGAALFGGQHVPAGATPVAQAYAGHQFGGYSPRLGDGRALLLGEWLDPQGLRHDIAFKGSGRTPFSRGGDGKAALGPMLREYLISEAMHALRIPTTRCLAVVATGEPVLREAGALPGAVLTRVAASHLRVGTFQYAAALDDASALPRLLRYTLARHDPQLQDAANPALALLGAVAERQAQLVAQWLCVGFIHGVMNTDNMTLSGQTIDYGPCAFMDRYDPDAVFSSIDHHGRYAYGNQASIARWNLARLAESLLSLIDAEPERAVEQALAVIDAFPARFDHHWLQGMRQKLGMLALPATSAADDMALAQDFLASLQGQGADFTLAFSALTALAAAPANTQALLGLFANPAAVQAWLPRWQQRLQAQPGGAAQAGGRMRLANPAYIARNHRVEEALSAASNDGDLGPFNRLLAVVQSPFENHPGAADLLGPLPAAQSAAFQTFCGT